MNLLYIDRPLVINPALAEKIGLNEAMVLQQMHYWLSKSNSGKEHDGRIWIYNTYEQWTEQFPFWSESTIKRTISSLKNKGLIKVKQLKKQAHDRTNYYTIVYENPELNDSVNMTRSIESKRHDPRGQSGTLSTETTTENTTDIIYSDQESLNERAVEPVALTGKSVAAPKPKKQKNKITASDLILEFGVSEQIANDYLVARGKAPLTPTALKLILNEADKIGWSLQQALTACCENSWRGFRADWIKNQQQRLGSQNNEGFKTAQASIDRLNDTSWAK